jgi:hypothetical protein
VPIVSASEVPEILFTADGSAVAIQAILDPAAFLDNQLAVSSSTLDAVCSFAGGCDFSVAAPGLTQMIQSDPENNKIQVCGQVCELSTSADSATAVCKLPKMSTLYSDSNFGIQIVSKLTSGTLSSSYVTHDKMFDGNMYNYNEDWNADCHVTIDYGTDRVAVLDKMKLSLPSSILKSTYIGLLVFQGSNDGVTWDDLYSIDDNARSGWNYMEWTDPATKPTYQSYRFKGSGVGACVINEVELYGVDTINDDTNVKVCSAEVITNQASTALAGTVTFEGALTPTLGSIAPRFGSVVGNEPITFTGTDFSDQTADYAITIDGVDCAATAATTTSVTCTTGSRPGIVEASLSIEIAGKGRVSTQGLLFIYANVWSSTTTWGGEFPPLEGESIHVPKGLNLLLDLDSTPILKAIIVEGSLIIAPDSDPTHHRTLDAFYIFVNGGSLEVGTEEFPYTSKVTITMHGSVSDPYLPIYGNKVIGIRHGQLDMIGPERVPTWTVLDTTADVGANTMTLQIAVDWQAGEHISIASTSYEAREAEKRTIVSVDRSNPDKPILTLDSPLIYKHFAATQTFGSETIDMRAEVGLLSRNIVFRGDPETSLTNEYGATIFLHSMGDDSLTARIAYIEMTDVGQAFKLGRYALHFHMIGNVHNSYVFGNSVHQGFNRAFTFHGTSYLRLERNVVYNVKGHNIFIEDAVERHNQIHDNLVMMTKRSWSLLNTD